MKNPIEKKMILSFDIINIYFIIFKILNTQRMKVTKNIPGLKEKLIDDDPDSYTRVTIQGSHVHSALRSQ